MARPYREYCGFGPRLLGTNTSYFRPLNFIDDTYNTYLAPILALNPNAFNTVHPTVAYGSTWERLYVNPSLAPANQAQAQDHTWSNYIWNQPNDATNAYDSLGHALSNPLVTNGRLKIEFSLAISASGQGSPLPPWFKATASNWCLDSSSQEHIDFNDQTAVQHAVDVLVAMIKKYGNDTGLHSFGISEAFARDCPVGASYWNNAGPFIWDQVHAAAPVDANGETVQIKQISPIFQQGVEYDDLEDECTGYAQTDIELRFPPSSYALTDDTRQLYDRDVVHVTSRGDYQKIIWGCSPAETPQGQNRTYNWTNAPTNPWGLSGNHQPTFEQYLWYHSENGPAPVDSLFYALGYDDCTDDVWQDQIIPKSAEWLEGGSMANTWGTIPSLRRHSDNDYNTDATYTGQGCYGAAA